MAGREQVLRLLAVVSGRVALNGYPPDALEALERALIPFAGGGGAPALAGPVAEQGGSQLALGAPGTALAPPVAPARRREPPSADHVRAVFTHWKQATGRDRSTLTRERLRAIKARLHDGLTVADLCRAINVAANDAFLGGDNDRGKRFDDLPTIFKNTSFVEGLLEQGGYERELTPSEDALDAEQRDAKMKIRRLREMYTEAIREGERDRAEQLNRSLGRLLQAYRAQFQDDP